MAGRRTAAKGAQAAQEPQKTESLYKLTQGDFKARNGAIQALREANQKGYYARLIIEKGAYKLQYAKGISKAEAERVKKDMEAAGIKTEVSEI